MKSSHVLTLALVGVLAACDTGGAELVGQWEPVELDGGMRVRFDADSTFVLNTGSFQGEGSYTVDETGRLTMTPGGRLAGVMPAGFTGSLGRDTLEVCGPGGTCTNFVKGE